MLTTHITGQKGSCRGAKLSAQRAFTTESSQHVSTVTCLNDAVVLDNLSRLHVLKWQTSRTTGLKMTGKLAKGKEHTIMTDHKWPLQQLSIGRRQSTLPFAATPETKI